MLVGLLRQFPPVNSGGLIEACRVAPFLMRRSMFPPVNSGGLIEADDSADEGSAGPDEFPPVNSGGLIEAG